MKNKATEILKPIQKSSVAEKVIHQIKLLIESGRFPPGSRLPTERELADMIEVSRPSIREALKALSLLGVVENRHGSGTYITEDTSKFPSEAFDILFLINKTTIFEIFEARKGMEGWVISLAARRRTKDDLVAMKNALDAMKASIQNIENYTKHERAFHMAVVDAAKNNVVSILMDRLYLLLEETKAQFYVLDDDLDARLEDYERHRQIYHCIEEKDEQGASVSVLYDLMVFERKLKAVNGSKENLNDKFF